MEKGKLYTVQPKAAIKIRLTKVVHGDHGYEPDFSVPLSEPLRAGVDWLMYLESRAASYHETIYHYLLWMGSIWEYRIGQYSENHLIDKDEWDNPGYD